MKRKFKWIAFAIVFVLIFIVNIDNTPIGERAIVVGMGIDMTDDGKFEISAQILVPTDQEKGSNGSAVTVATDDTISGALAKIGTETSMRIALSHCNLVILGMKTLENNAYSSLDYIVRNAFLSENALLAAAENAREILESKVAYSDMAAFYAQREFDSAGENNTVAKKTIKDYVRDYNTHGGANWLTIIERKSTQKPEMQPQGESGNESETFSFVLAKTAVIEKNSYLFTIDEKQTEALNYAISALDNGQICVDSDNGGKIELFIIKTSTKTDFDVEKKEVKVKLKLKLILKEEIAGDGDVDTSRRELTESESERLSKEIQEGIVALYGLSAEKGVDLFDVYGGYYKDSPKKFKMLVEEYGEDVFLKETKVSVETKIAFV